MSGLLLMLLVASSPEPVAVVNVARAQSELHSSGHESRRPGNATIVHEGDTLETGSTGWMEIALLADRRVRISAASRLRIGRTRLELDGGRIWVQTPVAAPGVERRTLVVGLRGSVAAVGLGASVILENSGTRGDSITVRQGVAEVRLLGHPPRGVSVRAGETLTVVGEGEPPSPRRGGTALADLVAFESRNGLGDLVGLEAYLLRWVANADIAGLTARRVKGMPTLDPEVMGTDGILGAILEQSQRAAPFFEEEVPAKGPNVRVEVEFAGD